MDPRNRSAASADSPHLAVEMAALDGAGQAGTEVLPTGQPRQGGEHGDDLKLDDPISEFFKQEIPVDISVLVSVIWASWSNRKGTGILSRWFSFISVVFLGMCLLVHYFTPKWIEEVGWRCKLAYLSVLLRIVAATFLLLSLDPAVRHWVVISPLSLLALVLLGYFFKATFIGGHKQPGENWGEHKAELKLWFDLSSQVVTFGFAGLTGTVIRYGEGSSDQLLSDRGYMAPDCFLSYSLVLGLLLQLLSTVPTHIWNRGTRERMAKVYLRIVAYTSLMFLVLASVMAAEGILQEWVSVAWFIVVVIPLLFFWLENRSGYGPNWFKKDNSRLCQFFIRCIREQDDDGKACSVLQKIMPFLFTALMTSNSKYSIERGTAVSLSVWFKCSVLFELYGVLSCAVRMVLFSEMPDMKRLPFARMVWSLSAFTTIIMTMIMVGVVLRLHPEEIKNIFWDHSTLPLA